MKTKMNKITPPPDMYIPYNVSLRFQSSYADHSKRNAYSSLITTKLTVEANVTKCEAGQLLIRDLEYLEFWQLQNTFVYVWDIKPKLQKETEITSKI